MNKLERKCLNCECYEAHSSGNSGNCHLNPPDGSSWPFVGETDKCWKFIPKEK